MDRSVNKQIPKLNIFSNTKITSEEKYQIKLFKVETQLSFVFYLTARVLTVTMETGDFNLILSFAISVFLNLSVILTLVVFTEKDASHSSKVDENDEIIDEKVDEKTSTHLSKLVENDSKDDKNDQKGSSNSP